MAQDLTTAQKLALQYGQDIRNMLLLRQVCVERIGRGTMGHPGYTGQFHFPYVRESTILAFRQLLEQAETIERILKNEYQEQKQALGLK